MLTIPVKPGAHCKMVSRGWQRHSSLIKLIMEVARVQSGLAGAPATQVLWPAVHTAPKVTPGGVQSPEARREALPLPDPAGSSAPVL